MKIKCLIVDDEPLALDVLETHIEKIAHLELVGRCQNAIEAFNFLQKERIDLLFLDIQMPQLTGLDFMKTISNPPQVIFTTAYRDYALESYELNALDYLLKPISFERFLKAIHKYAQLSPNTEDSSAPRAGQTPRGEAFIYLKADKKMVRVLLSEILYIESLKDYVRVKTPTRQIVSYQKISYLAEKLPEERFLRVHRSFIVSIEQVEAFSATHIEIGTIEIPIGRNYKKEVLQKLQKDNLLED